MNLEEIRKYEDEKIVEHLKAIYDIVNEKCSRCNSTYGCLGCTLSHGDGLKGYVNQSINMMLKQNESVKEKIIELFGHKNFDN